MAITFNMSNVSVSTTDFTFPSSETTLDGVKFKGNYTNSVIETKHGRLTANGNASKYDFTALTGGEFQFTDGANASVQSFDGSAATSKITFNLNNAELTKVTTGAGNDVVTVTSVTGGVLDLGAGNDTVSVTAGNASVTLGTGADVVKVADTGASVTVTDYNYAEGDKFDFGGTTFSFDYGTATATLSSTGGSSISVVTAMNNGVYELKNKTTHYVRTDVASVDYVATEAVDFSSNDATTTLNLTLAGKNANKNTVSVGATEGTVNIVAGKAQADITVDAGVEFGLGISKHGSVVSVNNVLDADDTLYLMDGSKIADVKFGSTGTLNYGTTSVNGGYVTTGASESKFKYDIKGEKGVLAYAIVSTGAVTYAEDVTYYANAATVDATESGDVVLNLNGVCGDAFADTIKEIKGVTSGLVAGRNKENTTIKIQTESGKKTEVYGGVAGNDSIDLNGDEDAINVIWYSNGDGKDTVTGFNKAEDSVYFHDAAAAASILNDVTKVVGNNDLTVSMDKSNVLTLKGVVAATETKVINFNDIAGNNFKVAVGDGTDVKYTSGVNIYKNAKTLKVEGEDELVIYTGAKNDQYGYYDKTITTIDATDATGTVYLSGTNTNGMEIRGGEGVNNMWGGGDQVQTLTGGDGVNVFWFGNGDGRDTAKNAKAEDGVNLYNVEKIDDVTVKTSTNYFTVNVGSDSLKVDLGTAKADEALKTFTFADKAGVQYTYDTKTNKFQQK